MELNQLTVTTLHYYYFFVGGGGGGGGGWGRWIFNVLIFI